METIVTPAPVPDTERPPNGEGLIDVPPPDHPIEVIDRAPTSDPPPELVDAVVAHFTRQRDDLLRRVANIETLLGFVTPEDAELAVRVAKLERFCGLRV